MSEENRSKTAPLAVVKSEESNQTKRAPRRHSVVSTSTSTATSTSPTAETSPEIELPPRFRLIVDAILQTQPELVQLRYLEFLNAETGAEDAAVHDADQVKLFFQCSA
jgi:hypothetical protein